MPLRRFSFATRGRVRSFVEHEVRRDERLVGAFDDVPLVSCVRPLPDERVAVTVGDEVVDGHECVDWRVDSQEPFGLRSHLRIARGSCAAF